MHEALLVNPGDAADLAARDPGDRLGLDKGDAPARLVQLVTRLAELQTRLYAEQQRSILLVLQGLDTSGKDGTIRRVFTGLNQPLAHGTVKAKHLTTWEEQKQNGE